MNDPATLELAAAVDRLRGSVEELTLKLTMGHVEDPDSAESFLESAEVSCPAAAAGPPIVPTRTLLLEVLPPERMSATLYEVSFELETANAWADDNLAGGLFLQITVGGEARPGLSEIRKSRNQGRTFVAFDRRRKLQIWGVNMDSTRAIVACVGVAGFFRHELGALENFRRRASAVA
jgi:hypothetical protein